MCLPCLRPDARYREPALRRPMPTLLCVRQPKRRDGVSEGGGPKRICYLTKQLRKEQNLIRNPSKKRTGVGLCVPPRLGCVSYLFSPITGRAESIRLFGKGRSNCYSSKNLRRNRIQSGRAMWRKFKSPTSQR